MKGLIFILLFAIPVILAMKRDFQRGMCGALALFASVSNGLVVEGVGDAFELTFQRILLAAVVVFWLGYLGRRDERLPTPFLGVLLCWWVATCISLMVAKDGALSLKWFISFSTEYVLFYVIVSTTLVDAATVGGAFRALCVSTAILAFFGAIEYYYMFNPFIDWMGVKQPKDDVDVLVSFKHRILFGYSMAMGYPLLMAWAHAVTGRKKVMFMTGLVMLTIGCCYFSNSRGPWFGAALAGVIMYALGTAQVRKSMHIFALLSVLVLIFRPGVRATVWDLVYSTFDKDSYRGRSYYYRNELWPVGLKLVKKDFTRTLFGYGCQATETFDLSDQFQYGGSTFHTGYSSWDNNFAADMVEFGFVGLGLEILFYALVLFDLGRAALRSQPAQRNMATAIFAAAAVYVLAMTNVYMFSPQLKCLFLTLIVIGKRLPLLAEAPIQSAASTEGEEEVALGRGMAATSS